MPIISFWSPEDSSQLANTATTVAISAILPTKCEYKCIVTQTHYSDMSLESSFINMDRLGNKGNLDISDVGIDALDRLLRSNKLTPENISNYVKPILKGRLELLYGTFKNDMDSYSRILETFPLILDYASQYYDIVLVDLNKGYDSPEINQILQKSDLIVISMNQNLQMLKKIFKSMETLKILQEKTVIPVLGRYDRFSKYNSKNIARNLFNYKKPIYKIPYNTQFFDSCNEGKAMDFFLGNSRADIGTDRNGYFISEVSTLADSILESIKPRLSNK